MQAVTGSEHPDSQHLLPGASIEFTAALVHKTTQQSHVRRLSGLVATVFWTARISSAPGSVVQLVPVKVRSVKYPARLAREYLPLVDSPLLQLRLDSHDDEFEAGQPNCWRLIASGSPRAAAATPAPTARAPAVAADPAGPQQQQRSVAVLAAAEVTNTVRSAPEPLAAPSIRTTHTAAGPSAHADAVDKPDTPPNEHPQHSTDRVRPAGSAAAAVPIESAAGTSPGSAQKQRKRLSVAHTSELHLKLEQYLEQRYPRQAAAAAGISSSDAADHAHEPAAKRQRVSGSQPGAQCSQQQQQQAAVEQHELVPRPTPPHQHGPQVQQEGQQQPLPLPAQHQLKQQQQQQQQHNEIGAWDLLDAELEPLPEPELVRLAFLQPQTQTQTQAQAPTQAQPPLQAQLQVPGQLQQQQQQQQRRQQRKRQRQQQEVQQQQQQKEQHQQKEQQQEQERQAQSSTVASLPDAALLQTQATLHATLQRVGSIKLWTVCKERAAAAQPSAVYMQDGLAISGRVYKPGNRNSYQRGLGTTNYRGVTRHRRTQKFEAYIWNTVGGGKQMYLGGFDTDKEAAFAHDLTSIRFYGGRLAVTNFALATYAPELDALDAEHGTPPKPVFVDGCPVPTSLQSGEQMIVWRQILRGKSGTPSTPRKGRSKAGASRDTRASTPESSRPTTPSDSIQQVEPQVAKHTEAPTRRVQLCGVSYRLQPQKLVITGQIHAMGRLAGKPDKERSAKESMVHPPETHKAHLEVDDASIDAAAAGGGGALLSWGIRSQRSSRVHWPAGCSTKLITSLAGQNGQAALLAAGITEKYRERLAADSEAGGQSQSGVQPGNRHSVKNDQDELEAVMQPLQAAATAAAAAAAVKLRQQQLKLLQEQEEYQQAHGYQQDEEAGCGDGVGMDADAAASAAAATAAIDVVAQAALEAAEADAEAELLAEAAAQAAARLRAQEEEMEMEMEGEDGAADEAGDGAVFGAMDTVLAQLEVHNSGLGACLAELTVNWSEAWQLGTAAAVAVTARAAPPVGLHLLTGCELAAAGGVGPGVVGGTQGRLPVAASLQHGASKVQEQQQLAQQRTLVLRHLVARCLQQQEAAEKNLRLMRRIIAPFLPYSSAGQLIPDSAGDVSGAVLHLQLLHKQHANSLSVTHRTLKQLQAALTAAMASLQGSGNSAAGGKAWAGPGAGGNGAVRQLVGQVRRDFQGAWGHVVGSMKLVGLTPPCS